MGAHDELLGGTWKESKYMLDTFTQLPIKVNNVSRIGLETSVAINHTTYKYKEQQTLNSEYFGWVDMTNLYHFPAFATLECAESSGKLPAGSIALRTCPKVGKQSIYQLETTSGYTVEYQTYYEGGL